jgi:SAM-dependent methyltransferase
VADLSARSHDLDDQFACPECKAALTAITAELRCRECAARYPIVDDVPDLFAGETEHGLANQVNNAWLDPAIVEARQTVYDLSTRELRGMAFCMAEIGRISAYGCRILEVGMGTGHFTRWLSEVVAPRTHIFAFDFSWPIIARAKPNAGGLPGVTLFRANARGRLPFLPASFDILLIRLAPLGPHGVPSVQAGFELLKPGGWYFEAGWEPKRYDTPPNEWAIQHGYASAEHHVWQYRRVQTVREQAARRRELSAMAALGGESAAAALAAVETRIEARDEAGNEMVMTYENLLIAQKPPPAAGSWVV